MHELIAGAVARHADTWSFRDETIRVRLGQTGRHQEIRARRDGSDYVLATTVLPAAEVTADERRWRELARRAWLRNAEHELVTFGFDDHDNLVACARHPAEFLDPEELELYIEVLSRESDRFEYLLTGADAN